MPDESKRDFFGASHSTTLSEGLMRALTFPSSSRPSSSTSEHRPLSPAAPESPSEVIKRALSVRSFVSTSSSFAERMERARGRAAEEKQEYRIIGVGTCGTVFEMPGTPLAVKKGPDTKAMWNDFLLTSRIHNAIADTREVLQDAFPERTLPKSPQCTEFMLSDSKDYWEANLDKYPRSHRETGAAFHVDRILPLPQPIREALIKLYFEDSDDIREEARNDVDNKDCLVRIYLGENETQKQESGCYDSLRNFPLRLNMIEDLDLDKSVLTTEMAIALAIIHWQAKVDAMDVEFVLGSSAATSFERRRINTGDEDSDVQPPPIDVPALHFNMRSTHFWVLDFDKATTIKFTANDVDKKLVPAFLGNDPYYPRPDVDEELWEEFSRVYLRASQVILENRKEESPEILNLPRRFLAKVAEMIKENEDWDPEEQIIFGN